MVADALLIPALNGQGLQRGIGDEALPAAPITDQQPIGESVLVVQSNPAQIPQAGVGLEHPEAPLRGIFDLQAPEDALQREHLRLVAGRPQAKPAQQHQPNPSDPGPPQQQEGPQADGGEGEHLAAGGGDLDSLALAAGELPDQGLEDQAAVQGQSRQQVEEGQDQIQAPQFADHGPQQGGGMAGAVAAEQQ